MRSPRLLRVINRSSAHSLIAPRGASAKARNLAQETFITARLRLLRERNKLRAWLCGIARGLRAGDEMVVANVADLAGSFLFDLARDSKKDV